LLESGLRPLYVVDQDDVESVAIADALGFMDTGVRQSTFAGSLKRT
jgi:hypothetical protein